MDQGASRHSGDIVDGGYALYAQIVYLPWGQSPWFGAGKDIQCHGAAADERHHEAGHGNIPGSLVSTWRGMLMASWPDGCM